MQLSSTDYAAAKSFLQKTTGKDIGKDTLFVHYTFRNDGCWRSWNDSSDVAVAHTWMVRNHYFDSLKQQRRGITYFEYREAGDMNNKWLSLNPQTLIDSTGWLFETIIQLKSSCGTSVAIFPNGTMVRVQGDAHYVLLFADSRQWQRIFEAVARQ